MLRAASSRSRGSGFTMIELLIVTAIGGVLIAILVPAVQAAREVANRYRCQNNLKELSLAFHHHHSQHGFFPSGGSEWWTPPNYVGQSPAIGPDQQGGWGFQVLPYVEGGIAWQAGAVEAIGAPLQVFFCPSRRDPQTLTYLDEYSPALTGGPITHALCDYAASNMEGTGVVRQRTSTRFDDITDGTTNTLLIADKRLNLSQLGQWQPDDNEGYTCGWDEDTIRTTDTPPAPDYAGDGTGEHLFGSSHPSLFNAAFADGSVHALRYTIDPQLFHCLGNISDGQALDPNSF